MKTKDRSITLYLKAFVAQDYEKCVKIGFELLSTQANHELAQILIISLQRLQRSDDVDFIAPSALLATVKQPWQNMLLKLTLGQIEPSTVISKTKDDKERCQAHYYAGSRYLTLGRLMDAKREFDFSRVIETRCSERFLAEAFSRIFHFESIDDLSRKKS